MAQSHPQAISDLEKLDQQGQFNELASSALPEMKAQLSEAQKIRQSASNTHGGQPVTTGTVTDPRKASD